LDRQLTLQHQPLSNRGPQKPNCQKKKEEEEEEDKLVNFRTKGPTKAKTIPMVKQLETLDVTSKFFIKILLKS